MQNEYQCASCKEIFEKGWSDEDANRESEKLWGVKNASEKIGKEMVVICDDCFNRTYK